MSSLLNHVRFDMPHLPLDRNERRKVEAGRTCPSYYLVPRDHRCEDAAQKAIPTYLTTAVGDPPAGRIGPLFFLCRRRRFSPSDDGGGAATCLSVGERPTGPSVVSDEDSPTWNSPGQLPPSHLSTNPPNIPTESSLPLSSSCSLLARTI